MFEHLPPLERMKRYADLENSVRVNDGAMLICRIMLRLCPEKVEAS